MDSKKALLKHAAEKPTAGVAPAMTIAGVVSIALVFALMIYVSQPAHPVVRDTTYSGSTTTLGTVAQTTAVAPSGITQADVDALTRILGADDAAKLLEQAKTSPDARWIASHTDSYAMDDELKWKILKLAADEPAALKYVREFPEKYPAETVDMNAGLAVDDSYLTGTDFDTGIPHFYQWDRRWGYTVYSPTPFGLAGCGPTCMAMVYQGLTGNTDLTPYDMGVRASERGFMHEYEGTDIGLFFDQAEEFGLSCDMVDISPDIIRDLLANGYVIVANVGPGYFSQYGHFFVLTRVTEDGGIIMNDPYSEQRSTQIWDADLIAGESIALFAFARYE